MSVALDGWKRALDDTDDDSTEVAPVRSSRRLVSRRVSPLSRESRATYYRGVAIRESSKKEVSHEHLTTPVSADSFKHLEVPSDLMAEAIELRKEIEAAEEIEAKVVMADTIQTIATQVGLLQATAKHLNKDVRDVTSLDVAAYRIHEREEFVNSVELDKVVLFSHSKALENFRAGIKSIASRYPENKLPEDLEKALKQAEGVMVARAENEEIISVPVSEDLFQEVQSNLFPSFNKKNITPQDFLDYVGGADGLIDPVTFHVRDLLIQLEKASSGEKANLLKQLESTIVAFESGLPEEFSAEEKASFFGLVTAQEAAENKMTYQLNRRVVMGDLNPERRLERSLDIHHPILKLDQTFYVHGDVTNVKAATSQMLRDEAPTVEFTARPDFNPPTGYRDFTPETAHIEPEIARQIQGAALNFPTWEGKEVASAINSAELILEMKLYKFFTYMYPQLAGSREAQKLFMEMYDVSPGEPTLEWALSYPCKEHTFHPEHPLWVQVFEDDEEVAPIVWPEYTPVSVEGLAEVASARGGEHATIRYLPHSKEQTALDAHYNHVFASIPVEKRFGVDRDTILADADKLSAGDKQKAESAWAALTGPQRTAARESWKFEATANFNGAQFLKSHETVQKLQAAAAASKL